uniref:Uncharacterized protein n=1 Tax=Meloidogyne javanica TaxID=6303 RepID=A0A915LMW0_MELJA
MSATLLSISIGSSENKFAVFIDELNNLVYDHGRTVLANFGERNIKEILNKYKRPRNLCDILGLEKFKELNNAFEELKELKKTCPCHDDEPRPSHIPDSWLYPNPKSRNKRSANVSLKLGERDEYDLVNGCENAPPIAIGDLFLNLRQINELKEHQKKLTKLASHLKGSIVIRKTNTSFFKLTVDVQQI